MHRATCLLFVSEPISLKSNTCFHNFFKKNAIFNSLDGMVRKNQLDIIFKIKNSELVVSLISVISLTLKIPYYPKTLHIFN